MDACTPYPLISDPTLDQIIRDRNGLLSMQSQESKFLVMPQIKRFEQLIDLSRKQNLCDKSPRLVSAAILNDGSFNAFAYAAKDSKFDFIGLHIGAVINLQLYFLRILRHPENFPQVGNVALEKNNQIDTSSLLVNLTAPESLTGPTCPVRGAFALLLAKIAVDFLFFHELTHLRNGHLEYLTAHTSATHWMEMLLGEKNGLPAIERQTLEFDADCGAILLMINVLYADFLAFPQHKVRLNEHVSAANGYIHADRVSLVKISFMAIYLLFRIFDTTAWEPSKVVGTSHPPAVVRMSWLFPTLFRIIEGRPEFGLLPNEVIQLAWPVILESEKAIANIRGRRADISGIYKVYQAKESTEYLESLKATWRLMRPELDRHKRGGNLAPAE